MDSDAIPREWIGKPVDVYLTNPEAEAIEISATLDEVREGGIRISHIGDIGQGPTMFCPWDSVRNVRSQMPENPPFGEDEFGMLLPYGEPEDEADVPERFQHPSARTLERVVPVAHKLTVGGITVAIASLELYENGLGVLRWQISFEKPPSQHGIDFGIPEPWFEIRDSEGRTLPWSPQGAGASDRGADGNAAGRRVAGRGGAGGRGYTFDRRCL